MMLLSGEYFWICKTAFSFANRSSHNILRINHMIVIEIEGGKG